MCLGVTTSCSIKVAAVINVPSLLISPLLPKCLRPFRNRNGSTGSVPAIDTGYFFSEHIILISLGYSKMLSLYWTCIMLALKYLNLWLLLVCIEYKVFNNLITGSQQPKQWILIFVHQLWCLLVIWSNQVIFFHFSNFRFGFPCEVFLTEKNLFSLQGWVCSEDMLLYNVTNITTMKEVANPKLLWPQLDDFKFKYTYVHSPHLMRIPLVRGLEKI